jgi:hypothetical protein
MHIGKGWVVGSILTCAPVFIESTCAVRRSPERLFFFALQSEAQMAPTVLGLERKTPHGGLEFISAPHLIHRHEDGTEEWMAFFKVSDSRPLGIMAQVKAR